MIKRATENIARRAGVMAPLVIVEEDQSDIKSILSQLGEVIAQAETRRRGHFLLRNTEALDLNADRQLVAAKAITRAGDTRMVKYLLRKFEQKLAAQTDKPSAAMFMQQLRTEARNMISEKSPRPQSTPPDSERPDSTDRGGATPMLG